MSSNLFRAGEDCLYLWLNNVSYASFLLVHFSHYKPLPFQSTSQKTHMCSLSCSQLQAGDLLLKIRSAIADVGLEMSDRKVPHMPPFPVKAVAGVEVSVTR